jgi:hypothetical protein
LLNALVDLYARLAHAGSSQSEPAAKTRTMRSRGFPHPFFFEVYNFEHPRLFKIEQLRGSLVPQKNWNGVPPGSKVVPSVEQHVARRRG